jgi:hypothetical protein
MRYINSSMRWLYNLFKYRKTFDAIDSYTKCTHTIKRYRWNFHDGSKELITDQARVEHYYAKIGQYYVTLTIESGCPIPRSKTATKAFRVTLIDMVVFECVHLFLSCFHVKFSLVLEEH